MIRVDIIGFGDGCPCTQIKDLDPMGVATHQHEAISAIPMNRCQFIKRLEFPNNASPLPSEGVPRKRQVGAGGIIMTPCTSTTTCMVVMILYFQACVYHGQHSKG